jgi:mannan endo-1,4-beta-mannosidase
MKNKNENLSRNTKEKPAAAGRKKLYLTLLGLLVAVAGALFFIVRPRAPDGIKDDIKNDAAEDPEKENFVRIKNGRFFLGKNPYVFVGVNYWQGAYLGADIIPKGKQRLIRELDLMKKHGIANLRITAASEKSSIEKSVTPAFQESPGVYNERLLKGLDFLLAEMSKRDMKAVMVMGNYWEWSGGMAQYVSWAENKPVADPKKAEDAGRFMEYSAEFYANKKAQKAYFDYLAHVIGRTNTVTGLRYADDPAIMTWQLANEPRPHPKSLRNPELLKGFYNWIDESARRIHALAPRQLVTVGNEGTAGCLSSEDVYLKAHSFKSIDYMTFHIWPKNWGWFAPNDESKTLENAVRRTAAYFERHARFAASLNKPAVLEEFGLGRDNENPSPRAAVHGRDAFLKSVFKAVEENVSNGGPVGGTNIWSWGGEGRARNERFEWTEGADFTGDPPQEPQGLNSVFDTDLSTLNLIRTHAERLRKIARP